MTLFTGEILGRSFNKIEARGPQELCQELTRGSDVDYANDLQMWIALPRASGKPDWLDVYLFLRNNEVFDAIMGQDSFRGVREVKVLIRQKASSRYVPPEIPVAAASKPSDFTERTAELTIDANDVTKTNPDKSGATKRSPSSPVSGAFHLETNVSDITDATPAGPASVATPARLNLGDIEDSWSPEETRIARETDGFKVRSLNGNTRALRGGDWLSTGRSGCLMTLAVAWKEHLDKQYGLTVAHPFTEDNLSVGASVFAFDSDEEDSPMLDGFLGHKSIKIGAVVSIDDTTDSAVFEIFSNITIDPLAVALSGGDDQVQKITLPTPFANDTAASLPYGKRLVMFGVARRGMIGVRVCPTVNVGARSAKVATMSYTGNAAGEREANGETKLSFNGDCGALYLDEAGIAWCMHTAIQGDPKEAPSVWTSRGALLQDVVNRHSFFFGGRTQLEQSSWYENQSSPVEITLETSGSRSAGGRYPRLHIPDEEEGCLRYQPGLPQDRIPMHFPDEEEE